MNVPHPTQTLAKLRMFVDHDARKYEEIEITVADAMNIMGLVSSLIEKLSETKEQDEPDFAKGVVEYQRLCEMIYNSVQDRIHVLNDADSNTPF